MELKQVRIEDGNYSKAKFEVQDKPRFKRRFSNHGPSNSPRFNKSKVPTPKTQEGKGGRSYVEKPFCAKCDKRHTGKFLVGKSNYYGCEKSGHMKRYFPMMKSQGL